MKLILPIVLGALLGLPPLQAEVRTFTNTDGRTVDAELVALEDGDAVLRLRNRKIAKVPLDSLSAADQTFARDWWEKNKNKLTAMDVRLTIKKETDRIDRKVSHSGGNRGGNNRNTVAPVRKTETKDEYLYSCSLESYVPRDVENIEVHYTIYKRVSKRDKNGSETVDEEIEGSTNIRRLEGLGSAGFETETVTCEDSSQSGGKGPREWHRESIRGVVFTLSAGGREFLKQSDPETLLDRLEEEREREEARDR